MAVLAGVAALDTEAAQVKTGRARRPTVGLALVVLAVALFLVHGSRTIAAPFGDSHDGRNAGVWAAGSRALREHGPITSRLGTRSAEGGVYANHPPLIYLETAVAEWLGHGTRASTRAPAWLGSVVALALLARLLGERSVRPNAVGVAVLLAATTPMFLVYGTMLDTPVSSLPFGVALLLEWERARAGGSVRPACAAGLAALAVLAGWQALLLSVAVGGWAILRVARGRGRRVVELGFVAGALTGAALLLAWLLWAFGGTLRPLVDQFVFRTGGSTHPVAFGSVLSAERRDESAMFGVAGLLALAGIVVALRSPVTRGLAALALAVTVPYPIVFRSGTVNHNYWGYWFLLPVAVGLGAGAEAALRGWRSRGHQESAAVLAVAGMGVLLVVVAWVAPLGAESMKLNGYRAGEAAMHARLGPVQREAWYSGAVGVPPSWLSLAARRPAVDLSPSRYVELAGSEPADLVLVGEVGCLAGADQRTYVLRTVGSLLDRPPAFAPCQAEIAPQPASRTGR